MPTRPGFRVLGVLLAVAYAGICQHMSTCQAYAISIAPLAPSVFPNSRFHTGAVPCVALGMTVYVCWHTRTQRLPLPPSLGGLHNVVVNVGMLVGIKKAVSKKNTRYWFLIPTNIPTFTTTLCRPPRLGGRGSRCKQACQQTSIAIPKAMHGTAPGWNV